MVQSLKGVLVDHLHAAKIDSIGGLIGVSRGYLTVERLEILIYMTHTIDSITRVMAST
jgi:hypothetical protein